MSRKTTIVICIAVVLLISLWLITNPPGRFGKCGFAFTTYNSVPRIVTDMQIRCDGKFRKVEKTHDLGYSEIEWLLMPPPEVLILSTGWSAKVVPAENIRETIPCEVHLLPTGKAIEEFNRLKREGRRVAIHLHSTC
ncbi:MAG: hypothetical protein HY318_15490 [Armatimonadetes bacterium]|nr:hypothetical protein [Armatimonadota bacterium]